MTDERGMMTTTTTTTSENFIIIHMRGPAARYNICYNIIIITLIVHVDRNLSNDHYRFYIYDFEIARFVNYDFFLSYKKKMMALKGF